MLRGREFSHPLEKRRRRWGTGFGSPLLGSWTRGRRLREPRAGFRTGPVRLAAKIAVAALVLPSLFLVYRLVAEDDVSLVTGVPGTAGPNAAAGSTFEELRDTLQSLSRTEIGVPVPTVPGGDTDRRPRGDKPRETSTTGSVTGSAGTGSGSTGSGSTDSGSPPPPPPEPPPEPPPPPPPPPPEPGGGGPGGGGGG